MRDGERMKREVCEMTDENDDDDVDARAARARRRPPDAASLEWCAFRLARIPNERITYEDDARGTND